MAGPSTTGARIKYWRLRRGGITQAVLAGLAGVSQSYVSQVEAGRKSIERRSTLVAIAKALQISVADLLGQPGDPTDPLKAEASAAIPDIWAALIEIDEGERRKPTLNPMQIAAALDEITNLRARADYTALARALPKLLIEAAGHDGLALPHVAYAASTCLRHLGYRHLALSAAKIALTAAQKAEHPAWIGAGRFVYVQSLPIEAASIASRTNERALNDLQRNAAAPDVRQMLGQLHLAASLVYAVDRRPDDARSHLSEAAREAATLGEPAGGGGFNLCAFGPTNVELWRMSVEAELGEWGRVIEIASMVRPHGLRMSNRHQSYWMDLGRALAHTGRRDQEALAAFMQADRAGPVAFSINPMAHDMVLSLVHRAQRRSISEDLRILAGRLGIDVPHNRG